MTQIVVLPHSEYCPEGAVVEVSPGTSICEALLENDIPIEHACDMVCACTTCHVIVKEGYQSLNPPDANEEDITHSIFYTAITRARQRLRIFWTPETQQSVLSSLRRTANQKDVFLLGSRRGLKPVEN